MQFTLVDAGYLMFYRYHATRLWYKRAREYVDDSQMASDPDFIETFTKRIESCLAELLKANGGKWEQMVICTDCRRSDIWRNSHTTNYKGTRENYTGTGLATAAQHYHAKLKAISSQRGVHLFKVDKAEADDIVAHTKYLLAEKYPDAKFDIVTSDTDYFQILDEKTKLVRLDKKDGCKSSTGDPQLDLKIKILMGDSSDNIPSCFPKCGYKTALKLAQDNSALEAKFVKFPASRETFANNQRLIDFRCVPDAITSVIKDLVTTHLFKY
jgi:5'-3' exonuclease